MGPNMKAGVMDMYKSLKGNGVSAYFDDMFKAQNEIKICALTGALSCFVFLILVSCCPSLIIPTCIIVT